MSLGVTTQASILAVALGGLFMKWRWERDSPNARTPLNALSDFSKQVIGFVSMCALSDGWPALFAPWGSDCRGRVLGLFLQASLGTLCTYISLRSLTYAAESSCGWVLVHGVYGDAEHVWYPQRYRRQLCVWLAAYLLVNTALACFFPLEASAAHMEQWDISSHVIVAATYVGNAAQF